MPNIIQATRDPLLRAVVVACRPLWYAKGADPALDRPAFVRAASGLARVSGRMAVVQDDSNFLALIEPGGEVQAITLPAGPDGRRQFDDLRGTKALKLDLEGAAVTPDGTTLIAFGSGSSPRREQILLAWNLDNPDPQVRLVPAPALYACLRDTVEFAGSELNIEGAAFVGGALRLFGRGNGAPRAQLLPLNATCDLDWPALERYLADPEGSAPPLPQAIQQYHLGDLGGSRLDFTDATPAPGGLLYAASAENSPDAVGDGPVAGSALGILPAGGSPRWTPITTADGTLFDGKVEGVLLDTADPRLALIVLDRDTPALPGEICTVRLEGAWFNNE